MLLLKSTLQAVVTVLSSATTGPTQKALFNVATALYHSQV